MSGAPTPASVRSTASMIGVSGEDSVTLNSQICLSVTLFPSVCLVPSPLPPSPLLNCSLNTLSCLAQFVLKSVCVFLCCMSACPCLSVCPFACMPVYLRFCLTLRPPLSLSVPASNYLFIFPHISSPFPTGPSSNVDCDFEADFCQWSQHTADDQFNWTRTAGDTGTSNTGPSFDHTLKTGTYTNAFSLSLLRSTGVI